MKYVFSTQRTKRYKFPTHINDLVVDRSDSATSEVFVVIVRPGQATHLHKHDDTEQVFYVLSGRGRLEIGRMGEEHEMKPGDVVRIPPESYHKIACEGEEELRYLAIDCFLSGRPVEEPTWDSHVHVVCQEQGWKYDDIVSNE